MRQLIKEVEQFPLEITKTPTDNLISVYKLCLEIQQICVQNKVGTLSAAQVGVPWTLSVFLDKKNWRYFLNYSFEPLGEKKIKVLTRFINVERGKERYFLVSRYEKVKYSFEELVVKNQPELLQVSGEEFNLGILLQNEWDIAQGRHPHKICEEEFLVKK